MEQILINLIAGAIGGAGGCRQSVGAPALDGGLSRSVSRTPNDF
jgi:hypothetical protein